MCDRAALAFGMQLLSPETLSLMESFLKVASVLPWFGRLAINVKSPGRLCHAKEASEHGDSPIGFHVVGLVGACDIGCPGIQSFSRLMVRASGLLCVIQHYFMQVVF
jgi:hypothetical protein